MLKSIIFCFWIFALYSNERWKSDWILMQPNAHSCNWKYKLVKRKIKWDRYLVLISLLMWSVNEVEVLETAPRTKCFCTKRCNHCVCICYLQVWSVFGDDISHQIWFRIQTCTRIKQFSIHCESINVDFIKNHFFYKC